MVQNTDCTIETKGEELMPQVLDLTTRVGGSFTISLDSNPSTGYQWVFANSPDPRYVALLSTEYIPPPTPVRIGQSGTQVWRFQALHRGKTTISLKYCRPWDESDCANYAFTIVTIL
jgi:inhibitor of cysteine peptidase